ncbi:hypothetical protein F4780DRAFT_305284 [Xylariomycetidae sp. FL0641]|nr:hypothetical protein F4780DRAFT_305284 [Xylariomycetidae sp. FL0641]
MKYSLVSLIAFAGYAAAQTSTVNGRAEYMGTPVATNPLGIPTLGYNCAKMPSICENVNGNSNIPGRGNYALQRAPDGTLGQLQNVAFLELNVDTNTTRVNARRDSSCPGNWKTNHPCPQNGQPLVVPEPFNRGGRSISSGFVGQRLDPTLPQGAAGSYQIADPSGVDAGMVWTCDEFPPAFSVEGGLDANGDLANTYCAPWGKAACDGAFTLTEQNWQSYAHGTIRNYAGPSPGSTGVFTIHFVTDFIDDDNAWASKVDHYVQDGQAGFIYGIEEIAMRRRSSSSSDSKTLVSTRHYDNGTTVQLFKRVPHDHDRRSLGRRGIDEFDKRDGVAVVTRTIVQRQDAANCTTPVRSDAPQTQVENPSIPAPPSTSAFTFTSSQIPSTSSESTPPPASEPPTTSSVPPSTSSVPPSTSSVPPTTSSDTLPSSSLPPSTSAATPTA